MRSVVEDREGQNEDDVILRAPDGVRRRRARESRLSGREAEVLMLAARLSNREIAEFSISPRPPSSATSPTSTEKMGVRSRGEAARRRSRRLDLRLGRLQGED